MLLNSTEIKKRALLSETSDENYASTTYDLTIDCIIDADGNEYDELMVPSSGIVDVISKEIIKLPTSVTGFAHVKTSLSSKGLLALNIGLIDPGWEGPLSTTLVNFGDHKGKLLQKGETFLRLTFVSHEASDIGFKSSIFSKEKYRINKKEKFSSNFGNDFLSLDTHISKKISEISKSSFEYRIAIFASAFVLIQIALSYYLYTDPWKVSRSADYTAASSSMQEAASHNIYLRDQLEALKLNINKTAVETKEIMRHESLQADKKERALAMQIKNLQSRVKNLEGSKKATETQIQEARK